MNDLFALDCFRNSARPLTCRRLAEMMEVTPATALRAIKSLKKRGFKFKVYRVCEGRRGPPSKAWKIL